MENDHVWWSFSATSEETFQIEVVLQTLEDSVLDVVDTDRRTILVENDDDERDSAQASGSYASFLEWTAPAAGTYYIMVKAYGDETGTFTLSLTSLGGAAGGADDPCNGGVTMTQARAMISFAPDGGTADNQDCIWTVACQTGVVSLDFATLETEQDYDFVTLWDGSPGGTQIDSISGNLIDQATSHYASTQSSMTIEFLSDESLGAGGFSARYSCGAPPPPPPAPPPPPPPPPPIVGPPPPPHNVLDTGHMDQAMIQADGTLNHGEVVMSGDQEWFNFHATAGSTYQMEVMLGTLDDSIIDLIDTDGSTVIIENDDDERDGRTGYASYMEWTCPADGNYFVMVKGYGDSVGTFDVTVTEAGAVGPGLPSGGDAVTDPCNGGDTLTNPTGTIAFQPEGDYTDNIECSWSISCPSGAATPSLTITEFESEAEYDFLTVYDGPDSSSPQMEQLSGSLAAGEVSTTTMTSTSNSMDLVFTSDESIGAGGFVVNYQCARLAVVDPLPPPPPVEPPSGAADSNFHIIVPNGTPEAGEVTADSHEWYSFTGLAGESYQIECLLDGTLDDSVMDLVDTDRATIIVENDDDERDAVGGASLASFIEWTCPADGTYYVMIKGYDAYSTGTFHISVTRAGGGGGGGGGGVVLGDPCDGGMDLNVPSSTIVFQPDGNYEDNAACDWRIACPSGKATLDFTEFATESDYDFVTVYDGADASAPKLGELSGALVDILDTHFDAGSDVLLVEFTSDESITDGGFQARYTCG